MSQVEAVSQVEWLGLERQVAERKCTPEDQLPFPSMLDRLGVDCSGSLTKRTRAEEHQAKKSTPHSCILIGKGTAAHREGNAQ